MAHGVSELENCCQVHLVDDHALRRASMRSFLEDAARDDRFAITVTEADFAALEHDSEAHPTLVLLSIGSASARTPEVMGLIERVRCRMPEAILAVLSERYDTADVAAAIKAGARGFITTRLDPHLLLLALKFVLGGGTLVPPDILQQTPTPQPETPERRDFGGGSFRTGHAAQGSAPPHGGASAGDRRTPAFSVRQQEVLHLLQEGCSNKVIARHLQMCEPTVKVHVRQILRKLGATNRTQAALYAIEAHGHDHARHEEMRTAPRPAILALAEPA